MKNNILLISLLTSTTLFSQVGINTEAPKATLDIVGFPADNSKLDGIIAPRITGNQLRLKTYHQRKMEQLYMLHPQTYLLQGKQLM